jgi:DNA-binding GntR family transcriptional regulator
MTTSVRSRTEQTTDAIRTRILRGLIEADAWIKQDALAAELGVSKIPLREALRKLEEEGLVVSAMNRGFFVRPLVADEAEDIFALRLKIEPDAVADAAALATEAEHAAATALLARLQHAITQRSDNAPTLNRAFHLSLVTPARTPVTATLVERLHVLAQRYVLEHLEPAARARRANAEHRELLTAWLARDRRRVRALARDHITHTLIDLRAQLAAGPRA